MPRDTKGRPQAGVAAAKIDMPAASKVAPDTTVAAVHCPHCAEHRDRLERLEKHVGIAHKADEMKSEDQGGKEHKPEAGHVTEKGGNTESGRKRH